MPPQRTMPPAKALKTERTHEENQERAYIAASRRSDRSLEARVESARRASEIHKRRTGRSLRVTEQDVVNEEMYEEEDDDLPMQYRRLTAHLQTGSADFNRRLSAYLTNHVAMRTALDEAITNSYAQQYPNAPHFAHNQTMYPSPFMQPSLPPNLSHQSSPHSSYGQPYPTPGTPGYRPSHPARPASVSHNPGSPNFTSSIQSPSPTQAPNQLAQRRASGSSNGSAHSTPAMTSTPLAMQPQPRSLSFDVNQGNTMKRTSSHSSPPPPQHPFQNMNGYPNNIAPFTTSLPVESQMLLGPALDPNDPMTSILMAGSENMVNPFGYSTSSFAKPRSFAQSFDGMSATLAPSALDMSPHDSGTVNPMSTMSMAPPSTSAIHLGYDGNMPDVLKGQMFPSGNSSAGSGTVTPGIDGGWDAFINDGPWNENTA